MGAKIIRTIRWPNPARWLALAAALAVLVGCGPARERGERADRLAAWLDAQSYSGWSMYRHRGAAPESPPSPDGLTLGSPNIFAAVGCSPNDLTSLDVLWADRRTKRPLAKPMTVSLKRDDSETWLSDFPNQDLQRVRHTAIAVSQAQAPRFRVRCVDFAPMGPKDSFLVRWFLVENTGASASRVSLRFTVSAGGDLKPARDRVWSAGDLSIVSDARLSASEDTLEAHMGRLRPGQKATAALLLVGSREAAAMPAYVAAAQSALARLPEVLEETAAEWQAWSSRVPLETGDERTDDLLDSLLCLVRSHVGPEAIHTGSLRYPHNRAWIRDSYWAQRALLELGRPEEAQRNLAFFHHAWQTSGIASYYELPSGRSTGYGYARVELPHYLVLMVRDAERLAGAKGLDYWDMVKGCLDTAAVPESGLQPMNGDETWLLAAPVRELDGLLHNSWLLIASAEYAAGLAARAGDPERSSRYRAMAARARAALPSFVTDPQTGTYATGRGGDGSLDLSLCPEAYARGVSLGVLPASDPLISRGLQESWRRLLFDGGVRTHARSPTISGATPGHVLYAAADDPVSSRLFARDLVHRVLGFCSATGCVWEFHDLHDPAWGGEKRRLWDSAVLLMGLVHALFDAHRDGAAVTFTPKAPDPPAVSAETLLPPLLDPETAEALLAQAGPALILYDGSREHAARLARDLLRHRNRQYRIAAYPGAPPRGKSAIIISPTSPAAGWRRARAGYWLRDWSGPPQLWVASRGDVYRDTDPVLADLFAALAPQREKPLPFPDASLDLVARWGEPPSGQAHLTAVSGSATMSRTIDLGGERLSLHLPQTDIGVKTALDGNLLKLTVTAAAGRTQQSELTVTLPAGWWLVVARDMTGKWDRVADPVSEIRLPDGRTRLVYSFRPEPDALSLTFDLARLKVAEA